jgi:four helix bundle protein
MPAVKSYRDLQTWKRAMDLVVVVYKATDAWPSGEKFGLTDQIRRAAVSVPSNIAEGQGRSSPNDFLRFLAIARGSLNELETQILIAERLNYLSEDEQDKVLNLADEVSRLLRGLARSMGQR